jgi:hypothetical protein
MSIAQNFPTISPSLSLDFANVKALDPRITFARASSARYYDGVTTTKAEQNLFLYSQEFDNAYWEKSALTVTANTGDTVAPDGTTTAEKITDTTSDASHLMQTASGVPAILANTNYVFSCFIKNSDVQYVDLVLRGTTSNYAGAEFDLVAGTATSFQLGTGYTATATISSVGNSWYRCVVFVTLGANVSAFRTYIATSDGTTARSTSGLRPYVGTEKSAYIWGAQLEQRSSVTAYTPTTTQPITNYIPTLLAATDNVARFDHNPTTGESLGLLVEEQRTNLVLRSEEFSNAAWSKLDSSVVADTIVAPNGTLTGDALVENTATAAHQLFTSFSFVSGTTYTFSGYAKSNGRNFRMTFGSSAFTVGQIVNFDLSAGTGTVNFGTPTFSITPVGNGWFRCTITATATVTTSSAVAFVTLSGTSASYTGNGYSGIYIWGAQLEAGAFPTSYIPTVASQVTRSADAASMTGANFSSWYSQGEGAIYWDGKYSGITTGLAMFTLSDNTFNNRMTGVFTTSGGIGVGFEIIANSSAQTSIIPSSITPVANTQYKIAASFKTDNIAASRNGGVAGTDTSAIIPVVDRIYIGANANGGGGRASATISKLAFYPKVLTAANLQALTS